MTKISFDYKDFGNGSAAHCDKGYIPKTAKEHLIEQLTDIGVKNGMHYGNAKFAATVASDSILRGQITDKGVVKSF